MSSLLERQKKWDTVALNFSRNCLKPKDRAPIKWDTFSMRLTLTDRTASGLCGQWAVSALDFSFAMPLGIYIQVPFCQTKCTYCNFHTGVVSSDRHRPYAEAVCREIAKAGESPHATVDTVYVGGGTPSLLDPAHLAKIMDTLRASFRMGLLEVTLEADPETITPQKASAWAGAGFNRISLGSQSFDDRELKAAGRMHRRTDIFSALESLRTAGIGNISMDLIAGLPHQTPESWEKSVGELLAVRPEHVSVYMLEIDEGSRLGRESLAGGSRYSARAIPDLSLIHI